MGKSTINGYVSLPEGIPFHPLVHHQILLHENCHFWIHFKTPQNDHNFASHSVVQGVHAETRKSKMWLENPLKQL